MTGTTREVAAEFLGTFVLIMFGAGVVAQFVLSGQTSGQYLSINVAWALGVTLGVYAAAGVSGAHLNPAVTLALAVHRGFAWAKCVPYVAAQFARRVRRVGARVPDVREALAAFDGGVRQMRGLPGDRGHLGDLPAAVSLAFRAASSTRSSARRCS
jgi:hypothetical protein